MTETDILDEGRLRAVAEAERRALRVVPADRILRRGYKADDVASDS